MIPSRLGTAAALSSIAGHGDGRRDDPTGQFTTTVYSAILAGRHDDAIRSLSGALEGNPKSRAALSLLGYCYYATEEYAMAAKYYERLVRQFPDADEYKVYLAQSLYKAGDDGKAKKAALAVEKPELKHRVRFAADYAQSMQMNRLQALVAFKENDLDATGTLLGEGDDVDTVVDSAVLLFRKAEQALDIEEKDRRWNEAKELFEEAKVSCVWLESILQAMGGKRPDLSYCSALCDYRMGRLAASLQQVLGLISEQIAEHPELSVGSGMDGVEVQSVGHTAELRDSYLVEAFNLQAAIEYEMSKVAEARDALSLMPPRREDELDAVTLHNKALFEMEDNPEGGFEKLCFLMDSPANPPNDIFPTETFQNLLLLYAKHDAFDSLAGAFTQYSLPPERLDEGVYQLLQALLLRETLSPQEAYQKLSDLGATHVNKLRKLTRLVQQAFATGDAELSKAATAKFDQAVDLYIPVLMAQAKLFWMNENYAGAESVLRAASEYCVDNMTWQLNLAHVLFMRENYAEAIELYRPIVESHHDRLLDVTEIVLGNLCVSYVMTSELGKADGCGWPKKTNGKPAWNGVAGMRAGSQDSPPAAPPLPWDVMIG